MTIAIALIVSMCSQTNLADVAKKQAELQHQFPNSKVTVRIDKKCLKTAQNDSAE